MNKWSLTLLVILTSAIIAALIFTSQQSFWVVSAPILSIVLGWLLKTINDSVTITQQHQWELEKISHERTLKYYDTKLNEMSSFVVSELTELLSTNWVLDTKKRIIKPSINKSKFTKEWLAWASSARTFAEIIDNDEIFIAYTGTAEQSSKWVSFIKEFNSGKFESYDNEKMQLKFKNEIELYIDKLKSFQSAIEHVRLKVLRGEILIKQDVEKK